MSESKPKVTLTWEPKNNIRGKHTITWEGQHDEEQALEYFLRYSNTGGEKWQRISLRTRSNSEIVDFDTLPGGEKCKIAVVATDGFNTTTAETERFTMQNKPCVPMILNSNDGDVFKINEPIYFEGQGFYLEENIPEKSELSWISSVDGRIGKGTSININTLSTGSHKITLKAGMDNREGEASITIKVKGEERTKSN